MTELFGTLLGPFASLSSIHVTSSVMMVISVFAGSLVSGIAGFAFSAVSGAILFHWVPPTTAVPLLLVCSITTQLLSITKLWGSMQWRQCAPFLVGGVVGIPVGAKLLASL